VAAIAAAAPAFLLKPASLQNGGAYAGGYENAPLPAKLKS